VYKIRTIAVTIIKRAGTPTPNRRPLFLGIHQSAFTVHMWMTIIILTRKAELDSIPISS